MVRGLLSLVLHHYLDLVSYHGECVGDDADKPEAKQAWSLQDATYERPAVSGD